MHRTIKTYVRPKESCYKDSGGVCYALGASHNLDATNNNPLVVCFSSPQVHCTTRGYMVNCAPTLNAAAGMSGNNRTFFCKIAHTNLVVKGDCHESP